MRDPVEILGQFIRNERLEKLRQVASNRTAALTLVFDRVHHAHNISAVIRSADAFGVRDIHFVGERLDRNTGITLGAEKWVRIHTHASAEEAVRKLQDQQYRLVVTAAPASSPNNAESAGQRESIPIHALPFSERLAIIFGNELGGVNETFQRAASYLTHIPMLGFVESFNVSVAAAICMFCSTINVADGQRQVTTLSEQEQSELLGVWLRADIKGADDILARHRES